MKRLMVAFCIIAIVMGIGSMAIAKEVVHIEKNPNSRYRVFSELDEILFSEDFSDDYSDWTIVDGGGEGGEYASWNHSDSLDANSAYMAFEFVTEGFMFVNSDAVGADVTLQERLTSPSIDLSNITDTILLTFDAETPVYGDSCLVDISTTSATGPWTTIHQFSSGVAENVTLDITEYAGNSTVWISFYYGDGGLWLYGYAVDNIVVSSVPMVTLSGNVTLNTEDGNPLAGVDVTVDGDVVATTDADGHYTYDLLGGNYDVGFFLENHIPVIHSAYEVTGTSDLDVVLEFVDGSVSPQYLVIDVGPDSTGSGTIEIENTGYGPLEWNGLLNIIEDPVQTIEDGSELNDVGDLLTTVTVTSGSYGCVITPDGIFTANATYGGPPGTLTQHDFDGTVVTSGNVSDETNIGYDLSYDPTTDRIYAITTGTDEVLRFPPIGYNLSNIEVLGTIPEELQASGVAYDFNQGLLYFTDLYSPGFGIFDPTTGETTMLSEPPYWTRGITFMPFDPEGYTIWADSEWEEGSDNDYQGIYRYNPTLDEWDSTPIIDLNDDDFYAAGGFEVTNSWRDGFWDVALYNQSDNTVYIYEGHEGLTPWLYLDPDEGVIETGGQTQTITVNADIREEYLGRPIQVELGAVGGAELNFIGPIWHSGLIDVVVNFVISDVNDDESSLPSAYTLHQNYPNPFNPTTEIKFELPEAGKVKISVFNALGQLVMTLVDKDMSAGKHSMSFNGEALGSGVYFYKMESGTFTSIRKMTLVK